jgi:hypothetical protein
MPFVYSSDAFSALDHTITSDRLTPYLVASKGDKCLAVQLYERNTKLSEGLFGVIQPLEIALRNSIHHVMQTATGQAHWYDHPLIQPKEQESIEEAKRNLKRWNKQVTPARVIAELTFGFWVRLNAASYEKSVWVKYLYRAFPEMKPPDRDTIFHRLDMVRTLRNRIAHHEPIFTRYVHQDYLQIVAAIRWICPVTAAWVEATNSFQRMLRR